VDNVENLPGLRCGGVFAAPLYNLGNPLSCGELAVAVEFGAGEVHAALVVVETRLCGFELAPRGEPAESDDSIFQGSASLFPRPLGFPFRELDHLERHRSARLAADEQLRANRAKNLPCLGSDRIGVAWGHLLRFDLVEG